MDFNQTCTDIDFGGAKTSLDFGDLKPIFQGHRKSKHVEKCLVSTLSPEWIDINTPAEINH